MTTTSLVDHDGWPLPLAFDCCSCPSLSASDLLISDAGVRARCWVCHRCGYWAAFHWTLGECPGILFVASSDTTTDGRWQRPPIRFHFGKQMRWTRLRHKWLERQKRGGFSRKKLVEAAAAIAAQRNGEARSA